MTRSLPVLLVIVAGCVRPDVVSCGDGTECPVGYLCARDNLCVLPEQIDACGALTDGDRCTAGALRGICNGGLCLAGCGDAVLGVAEECDDGNLVSHDGCSSACRLEELSWQPWESGWNARACGGLAYHELGGKYVLFGGTNQHRTLGDHWERDPGGTWRRRELSPMPSPRSSHTMAYDATRNVIVVFGGYHPDDGPLSDTWEYDGSDWRQVANASPPPARANAAVAYAPGLGVVVFGGNGGGAASMAYNDTWRYDGSGWAQITDQSATPPAKRYRAAMAYDKTRGRLVLFGGFRRQTGAYGVSNETWELDPSAATPTWTLRTFAVSPPARSEHSLAWVPGRDRIVLFGRRLASGVEAGDTWEYDGTAWVQRLPGPTPPPVRACAAAATGGSSSAPGGPVSIDQVLLVGGTNQSGDLDDAWILDGLDAAVSTWTDDSPRFAPRGGVPLAYDTGRRGAVATSGDEVWRFDDVGTGWRPVVPDGLLISLRERFDHAAAYDAARDRTVIFGGRRTPAGALAELNEWDETTATWRYGDNPYDGPAGPSGRVSAGMVYHAKDAVTLLFGGGGGSSNAETWVWDGTVWGQVSMQEASSPVGESAPAMAYDPICERAILYGRAGETWAYTGQQWTRLEATASPGPRQAAAMTYDPRRGHVVLFGGQFGETVAMDLWELVGADGVAPCETRAPACPAAAVAWCPLPIVGTAPGARLRPGMTYQVHGRAPGLLVFGGFVPAGTLDDTWFLRYTSPTPDEVCDNGVDDDQDLKLDAADPDCGPW